MCFRIVKVHTMADQLLPQFETNQLDSRDTLGHCMKKVGAKIIIRFDLNLGYVPIVYLGTYLLFKLCHVSRT